MLTDDLRVLIVGDNPLARAGMASLLAAQARLRVVGQAAADAELGETSAVFAADVLAWEVGWDAARALEVLSDVRDVVPPALLLLADDARAADALHAGARGVLRADADADALTTALLAVATGLVVVHPALLASTVLAALPGGGSSAPAVPADLLTPREIDVLTLVAEGMANKAIALRLKISEHTVKFHVNAVMSKLGVQSRTEAVVRATRLGLITL